MKNVVYFKLVLLAYLSYMAYQAAKANGGSLIGNEAGVQVRMDPMIAADLLAGSLGLGNDATRYVHLGTRGIARELEKRYGIRNSTF